MPNANTTVKDVLKQLEALGDEKVRAHNTRYGAGDNQFGVKLGDIRALAKKIKSNHELGKALWKTGNVDAQLLATLIIKRKTCQPTRWIGWCGPPNSHTWRIG